VGNSFLVIHLPLSCCGKEVVTPSERMPVATKILVNGTVVEHKLEC